MWCYAGELFLWNFVLFTCICTHNLWKDKRQIPLGKSLEISSYSRAYVHIIYEKTKGKSLWENHMTYIGKQNIQAKEVYWLSKPLDLYLPDTACMSTEMSFKELFDHLAIYIYDPEQRWKQVVRAKRCLSDCSEVGGCGYDQCYFEGRFKE